MVMAGDIIQKDLTSVLELGLRINPIIQAVMFVEVNKISIFVKLFENY
jgi:hypothetical protein